MTRQPISPNSIRSPFSLPLSPFPFPQLPSLSLVVGGLGSREKHVYYYVLDTLVYIYSLLSFKSQPRLRRISGKLVRHRETATGTKLGGVFFVLLSLLGTFFRLYEHAVVCDTESTNRKQNLRSAPPSQLLHPALSRCRGPTPARRRTGSEPTRTHRARRMTRSPALRRRKRSRTTSRQVRKGVNPNRTRNTSQARLGLLV